MNTIDTDIIFYGADKTPKKDEIQLPVDFTVPMIGGKLVGYGVTWYKVDVTNQKVILAYSLDSVGHEYGIVTKEYNIHDVCFSGYPSKTNEVNPSP